MKKQTHKYEFSVVIPTFNRADFITDAINSVFSQTFEDYELIVVDDGSQDETEKILKQFMNKSNFKFIKINHSGVSAAMNAGIEKASGKYIARLDSDDCYTSTILEEHYKKYNGDKKCDAVYTQAFFTDEYRNVYDKFLYNHKLPIDLTYFCLKHFFPINQSSFSFRRSCIEKLGGYDENLPVAEDYDFVLRMTANYCFCYIDKPLVLLRHHNKNISRNFSHSELCMIYVWIKNREILGKYRNPNEWWLARSYYRLGRRYFYEDKYAASRRYFRQAWKIDYRMIYRLFETLSRFPPAILGLVKRINRKMSSLLGRADTVRWWHEIQKNI